MCGLVSIISRRTNGFFSQDMDLFEQMLILDQLRGKDAAGAFSVMRNGDQSIIKHATRHVSLMFETKEWKSLRTKVTSTGRLIVGHNRAATRGAHTSDNAHPFQEGKIILAHNGTIFNQKELSPDKDVQVDSNSIAIALDNNSIDDVIPKIDGAFALIWYNNEEENLYATRNDERPLSLVTTDAFYFLMSEPWMMACLWNRQNGRAKIENMREVEPGELLTFNKYGALSSRKVSLLPKKSYSGTDRGTNSTADTYTSWAARRSSSATKEVVEKAAAAFDAENGTDEKSGVSPVDFPKGATQDSSVKALQDNLAKRAQDKELSTSCALMRPAALLESTNTTKSGLNASCCDTTPSNDVEKFNESQESAQRNIIVQNKDFKPGDFTLIKIWKTWVQGKFVRFSGKITMPGKPMMDCVGVLPDGLKPTDWSKYIENMCTGKVRFATYTTGGHSIFVENIVIAATTDVHGGDVPWVWWNRALSQGCDECAGTLLDWERPFTAVANRVDLRGSQEPVNRLRCVCPDCLSKQLSSGDIYDRYTKKYNEARQKHYARCSAEGRTPASRHSSVQDREQLGEESSGKVNSVIILPRPALVQ